jgi:hypothetical protein
MFIGQNKAYYWRSAIIPLIFVVYFVLANFAMTPEKKEFYPFFNWSLFSKSGTPRTDQVLLIKSINGRELASPTLFYDLPQEFSAAARRNSRLAKTAERLNLAVEHRNELVEQALVELIETYFLREAEQVEYQLAVIEYDPIERYHSGELMAVAVVKEYRK